MKAAPLIALALLALPALTAAATEEKEGRALHDHNCLSCHDRAIYQREGRRITSREGLVRQVRRCELALGLRWFDEQIEAVAEHLNREHYHFE